MTYQDVLSFVGTYGLIYFLILFVGVLVYVFWPGNKRRFEDAARLPLKED